MGRRPSLPQPARQTHLLPKVMQASGTDSRSAKRFAASAARAPQYLLQALPYDVRTPRVQRTRVFPIDGGSGMEFVDRLLTCVDCGGEFVFTAGEQLFFMDKQFKNDPKRCKPCKSRRSAAAAGAAPGSGPAAAGISRTETRTECSECGISTTVPFKPTQGRPVLCRQCFKNKRVQPAAPTDTVARNVPAAAAPGTPTLVPPAVSVAADTSIGEIVAQPSSAA